MAELAQQLGHQDPLVRAQALWTLQGASDPETSHLATAAALAGDGHWQVRQAAVEVFRAHGIKAAGQAQALAAHLTPNAHPGVAAAAATALAALGPTAASEVVAALEAALDFRGEDRSTLVLAAAGAAPKAPATLRKPACAAAAALASLRAGAKSAAKVASLLKDPDPELRAASAAALGAMKKDGATYEAQVQELLNDPLPAVAAAALGALGEMASTGGPTQSVAAAVADQLSSRHPVVRAAAAKSLGCMGEEAQPHLDALARLLRDVSSSAKIEAIHALSKAGEPGQMYAAGVGRCTFDASAAVRVAACASLAAMGARGAALTEEVEQLLGDDWDEVREAAQQALDRFAAGPAKALASAPRGGGAALLFPGQGSQYLRMMADVKDLEGVKQMLATAKSILGYDILEVCLEGPEEKLEQTKFCQPALYIGGLAAVEKLRMETPEVLDKVQAVAGLSLGEYTALTFAGMMDFETGLRLVKLRGEAMQEAAEASEQAMCSVAGLSEATLRQLCQEVAGPGETCQIANDLFPNGYSCAGSRGAIQRLVAQAETTKDCLQAKLLKTAGAFHTGLMQPAKDRLLQALRAAEPNMRPIRYDVYMNLSGEKVPAGAQPAELIPMMSEQLCSCVRWRPAMEAMIGDGIAEFYECGPMKQLKAMMKRINQDVWNKTTNVSV